MADKLISELAASASEIAGDLFEKEPSGGAPSRKETRTQVCSLEATARAAQDDVIEASSGLAADGSLAAPAWNYIDAAALAAQGEGITLKAFTHLLDTQAKANADDITNDIQTIAVTLSQADILALHINDKTLIAAQGADTIIEIISMFAYLNNNGTQYAMGVTENIRVRYDLAAADFMEFSRLFITYAGCIKHRGTWLSNVEMRSNKAVEMYATGQITNNGGLVTVYIVYRVASHATCAI